MKHYNNLNPISLNSSSILNSSKSVTTYQFKYFLKKRILSWNYENQRASLNKIIVKAGFSNSIKEANNLINNNIIKVNDRIINQSTYICKSGDIIQTLSENSYLNNYIRRWNSIKFGNLKGPKGLYQQSKTLLNNNIIIPISYNKCIIK